MTAPIPPRNLISGQYQIGNLIFGRGTTVRVETFDIKPYDINQQDHQVSMSDEMRFGQDAFKPTTLEITFHVLENRLLDKFKDLIPNFWAEMPSAMDFQREWKFNEGRKLWGAIKPLFVCGRDEITRMVYGRPGQFTYAKDSDYTESIQCLGEFRRSDTLSYTAEEVYVEMAGGAEPWYLTRSGGDSDTWFRILAYGPMTNPKFTVGIHNIDLSLELEEGEVLEISSYPWLRRVVDSNRVNHANDMIGASQYLDRMMIPFGISTPIRWTSDELNTWVPDLGNVSWQEDVSSWVSGIGAYTQAPIPAFFNTLGGHVVVNFDLFNSPQLGWPIITPSSYIRGGVFQQTSAIIDTLHLFNSDYQYSQARVTEALAGRSAIVIMSNDTMTNYMCLEIVSNPLDSGLRLRYGSAYNTYADSVASWNRPLLDRWRETDVIAIRFDASTKTYTGYLNGVAKLSWVDSTGIVNTANRHQGYIFDMDGTLYTVGTGFRDMVSYDWKGGVPDPIEPGTYPPGPPPPGSLVGRAFLFWHDAWSIIV